MFPTLTFPLTPAEFLAFEEKNRVEEGLTTEVREDEVF